MQPPNQPQDEDDATLLRPSGAAGEITHMQSGNDSDATQVRPPVQDDATLIKTQSPVPEHPAREPEFGPLDTARLQKSPIPAHFKTPHNKTGLRVALGVIFLLSWLAALWWYKAEHRDVATPPTPPALEVPEPAPPQSKENQAPELKPSAEEQPPASTTQAPAAAASPPVSAPQSFSKFKIISKNLDELTQLAKTAIDANKLEPAEQSDSATGLLIQMNLVNAHDQRSLEIRRLLAEAHLLQSKQARSANNWDAAEHHTEEAWRVRDANSYLTPPLQ